MILDFKYMWESIPEILAFAPKTLQLTLGALLFVVPISLLFAFASIKRIRILYPLSRMILSVLRGTPSILQLFIFYTVIPQITASIAIRLNPEANVADSGNLNIWYAYLALAISILATMTEAFRSSIESVGKGQLEACQSVGLTEWQAYVQVILPQAFVTAVPLLGNSLVRLIKNTSLAFALSVIEMTGRAKVISAKSLHYFETYLGLFWAYLIVIGIVEILLTLLESKTSKLKKY